MNRINILTGGKMKFYEYHGYCTARVEEQRKCRNFAECKAGQGICKYSLLGGSCDWEPDTMDMIVDIYDCKGEKE